MHSPISFSKKGRIMKHFTIKYDMGFFEYDCDYINTKIEKKRKLFSTVYELQLYPNNNYANKIEYQSYSDAVKHSAIIFGASKNNENTGEILIELG